MTKESKDIKRIPIKEFREDGYLQELNRQFLHPLGLALEVEVAEDGTEILGGIWDYREDPEGIYYNYANEAYSPLIRLWEARKKAEKVAKVGAERMRVRTEALGYWIEPIPEE